MKPYTPSDTAFTSLVRDLRKAFILPVDKGLSITKQAGIFAGELARTLNHPVKRSAKAISNFFNRETYNEKDHTIQDLAAAWLKINEKLPETLIHLEFKKPQRKRVDFWVLYLKYHEEEQRTASDNLVSAAHGEQLSLDPLLVKYAPPRFNWNDPRKDAINNLQVNDHTGKKALIILQSIPYMGKSVFLSNLAQSVLKTKTYEGVIWKSVPKGYTLRHLLNDIHPAFQPTTQSLLDQADNMMYSLRNKNYLLVLDGFENAYYQTFHDFLRKISSYNDELIRIIISSNQRRMPNYLRADQVVNLEPYTEAEMISLAVEMGMQLDVEVLHEIYDKTKGLPYYAQLVLNTIEFNSFKMKVTDVINDLPDSPEFKTWVKRLLADIKPDEERLLNALSVFGEDFSSALVSYYSEALNINDCLGPFGSLQERGLILSKGDDVFEVLIVVRKHFLSRKFDRENRYYHQVIAEYLCPNVQFRRNKKYEDEDIDKVCSAIRHLHAARNYNRSTVLLKNSIPYLKRLGFYEELEDLLLDEILNNPHYDRWCDFHYAYWGYVTGNLAKGYARMVVAIENAIGIFSPSATREDVDFFIKSFQMYAQYLGILISEDIACELLASALNAFAAEDMAWDSRIQAVSALSWYYVKINEFDKALDINENILQDCLSNTILTRAVALTRIAVIKILNQEFELAFPLLSDAAILFEEASDRRGLCWCQTYLTLCDDRLGHTLQLPIFRQVLQTNKEAGLFDSDYITWLKYFKPIVLDKEVSQLLKAELLRVNKKWNIMRSELPVEDLKEEATPNIKLLQEKRDIKFNYKHYVHPFESNAVKIDSVGAASYIEKIKRMPTKYFKELFERKEPRKIFAYHLYNRAIADCMQLTGTGKKIINDHIKPNIQFIEASSDSIRLHFAYALQKAKEIDMSMKLLAMVSKNAHDAKYHIVKGNCYYEMGDFNNGYKEYHTALRIPFTGKPEKARALNNLARLIYGLKRRKFYLEAKNACIRAEELFEEPTQKLHSIRTLYLITAEITPFRLLVGQLQEIINTYKLTSPFVDEITGEIADRRKHAFLYNQLLPFTSDENEERELA